MTFDIVIPSLVRGSLDRLLAALARSCDPYSCRIVIVDDRREAAPPIEPSRLRGLRDRVTVLRGGGRGPAHARNLGWRSSNADWIAFLDDDVIPSSAWAAELARDLEACSHPSVAASYAQIVVPLPGDRAATDWERNVAHLATAQFITADATFRRSALERIDGFDERFTRAYREDADLALRLEDAGYVFERGRRVTTHPVRPASPFVSLTMQAGNADDALMLAIHGERWSRLTSTDATAYRAHERIVAAALDALRAKLNDDTGAARRSALAWFVGTAGFTYARISPGPRTLRETCAMVATSVLIPFAAVYHRLRGESLARASVLGRAKAVLFDRDGTLVRDRPILGDADRVVAMPYAREATQRLRDAHVSIGVVTNQPGLGRGAFTYAEHDAVCRRIDEILGPIGTWAVCEHAEDAACSCRKPQPGLILRAARALGAEPHECVVIGDIGSDMEAARAAGARAILVPTEVTRREEIARAEHVAPDLECAVGLVLAGRV